MQGRTPSIDGIELREQVGAGGFGTVWRAHQPAFSRDVAVKVLATTLTDPDARGRFERECQALGVLSGHPHIVTVHGAGITGEDAPYIVMEYLAGGTLDERLRSDGAMPWQEGVDLTIKLAGALELAHARHVLHRDLKPSNILLSEWGEPKLADFGIARIAGGHETRSHTITASLLYAAPEILHGQAPSEAADVYSLATTVHSLLAGRAAFAGSADESPLAIIARVGEQDPPDLRTAGVPGPVAEVLARAMSKEPSQRFASANDFASALADARDLVESRPPVTGDATTIVPGPAVAAASVPASADVPPDPPSTGGGPGNAPAWTPGDGGPGGGPPAPRRRGWIPWAAAGTVVVAGGVALAFALGGGGDGVDDDPTVAATRVDVPATDAATLAPTPPGTAPPTIPPSEPTPPAAGEVSAADARRDTALLASDQAPAGFTFEGVNVMETSSPEEVFCNQLDPRFDLGVLSHSDRTWTEAALGAVVNHDVLVFSDAGTAMDYTDQVLASSQACTEWVTTDDDGSDLFYEISPPDRVGVGDNDLLWILDLETEDAFVEVRIALVVVDSVVSILSYAEVTPLSEGSFTDFANAAVANLEASA